MLAQGVQKRAIDSVGHYQPAISPFPEWAPLAPATIARKMRGRRGRGWGLNGNPDSPLYRTGEFRKHIFYRINQRDLTATIGTTKDYIVNTELGTSRMPPRPVFGPAAMREVPLQLSSIQANMVMGLFGTFANGKATGIFIGD